MRTIIAPQALLWECPQTVAEQVHREECRRCSISGLLMLIWMSFRGTLWELLAVTGSLLGSSEWIREPPDQLKICASSVHPPRFLFWADFGATKWNSSRRNEKKNVWKSDIALITWSRSSTFDVHLQISYDPFEGFTITSAFAGGATCPAG